MLGQPREAGLLSPILKMKKPRPRQVKSLTREQCAARKYGARSPRHIFRACSDIPVPIQLCEHWKWDRLCPLQEWLGGAVCWALGAGEGADPAPSVPLWGGSRAARLRRVHSHCRVVHLFSVWGPYCPLRKAHPFLICSEAPRGLAVGLWPLPWCEDPCVWSWCRWPCWGLWGHLALLGWGGAKDWLT